MGAAELLVVLLIAGACYAALAPLRRAITRRMLRRARSGGRDRGRVIPLVRDADGVYTPPRRSDGDQR